MNDLDDQLLLAHERGDKAALVTLYEQAADSATTIDAACFYLTHAYVFALELGHANVTQLHARLVKHRRN